jgi:Cu+-exporting ATPase
MIEMRKIKKIELKTWGMQSVNCEDRIKKIISSMVGVKNIKVSYFTEKTTIEFDSTKTDVENIIKTIKDIGYGPNEIMKII